MAGNSGLSRILGERTLERMGISEWQIPKLTIMEFVVLTRLPLTPSQESEVLSTHKYALITNTVAVVLAIV